MTSEILKEFGEFHKYHGITYPSFLTWKIWKWAVFPLWKKFMCSKNIHLFDECASLEHILHCDACGLGVHISYIETCEDACDRASEGLYIESSAIEKSELT